MCVLPEVEIHHRNISKPVGSFIYSGGLNIVSHNFFFPLRFVREERNWSWLTGIKWGQK